MSEITITVEQDGKKISLCDISEETLLKARERSKSDLLVPEGIIGVNGISNHIGILNNSQIVSTGRGKCPWVVSDDWYSNNSYHLVKCARKDFKYGDIMFRTDGHSPDFANNHRYSLMLDSCDYLYWNDGLIVSDCLAWRTSYKVVQI